MTYTRSGSVADVLTALRTGTALLRHNSDYIVTAGTYEDDGTTVKTSAITVSPETYLTAKTVYDEEVAHGIFIKSRKQQLVQSKAYLKALVQRYQIQSPITSRGSTISVQMLTPTEVSNYRSRGFKVTSVSDEVRLSKGVTSGGLKRIPTLTLHRKRTWGGLPRTHEIKYGIGQSIVKRSAVKVSAQRRLFQEPKAYFEEIYYRPATGKHIDVSPRTAEKLRSRGIVLVLDPSGKTVAQQRRESSQTGYRSPSETSRHTRTESYSSSDSITSVDPIKMQGSAELITLIQKLTAELQNQKGWITEINRRLSSQVVDLGESTTHRSTEIQNLNSWSQENIRRIDETLINLGNASTDASKAVQAVAAQQTVKQVQQKIQSAGGGITGGITSFFTQPSNYILIIIVVVMLFMLKSKAKVI